MNEADKIHLREAAGAVETAETRLLGMIGASPANRPKDRMSPDEMAALREISSNLRAACTRLWTMVEQER